MIPTAVTLAYVLEKMTQTMSENWRFLKVCNHIWSQFDDLSKIIEFTRVDGNLFNLIKVLTLQQVAKRAIQRFETIYSTEIRSVQDIKRLDTCKPVNVYRIQKR